MLTVENGTSEVTEELLEEIRLLRRDLVEAITLATIVGFGGSETVAKLGVDDCDGKSASLFTGMMMLISHAAWRAIVWWGRCCEWVGRP
jgi:hypothetical protein